MKKILAVLLIACTLFSFASCNKNKDDGSNGTNDEVVRFSKMLAVSVPTSSDVLVTQTVNDMPFENTFSIKTGTVSGLKAAVYTSKVTTLRGVEDRELEMFVEKEETVWYVEGLGTSTNKGKRWSKDGKDFSPVEGSLAIDLKSDYIKSLDYSKNGAIETLVVVMTAANATKALSNFLDANQKIKHEVTVTITAAAGRVSSITISYVIPEDNLGTEDKPIWCYDIPVTIEAKYSYKIDTGDIPITLD